MTKSDQVYLTIFAFRLALALEVKRNQSDNRHSDIFYQATLTSTGTETKPPWGDLKSSNRFHLTHKCTLRESH